VTEAEAVAQLTEQLVRLSKVLERLEEAFDPEPRPELRLVEPEQVKQ